MMEIKKEFATPKVTLKTDTKKQRLTALKALTRGIQAGGSQIESYLPGLLDQALQASVWSWPRTTLRKNGSLAGQTRNIVDTGALKGSGKVVTKYLKTKSIFSVVYKAPYASLVHYGGYVTPYGDPSRQKVYIPGRPWVQAVIEGNTAGINFIDTSGIMEQSISHSWEGA